MTKSIDQRVTDIEDLIADIPGMISLRLETVSAAQQDMSARIGLVDRQMAAMVRDMRDLRNGVTAQLAAQDRKLEAIEASLADLKTMVETVLSRLPGA